MPRRVALAAVASPQTNVSASPGLNSTTPSRSLPMRSFGPGRSCRIATWRPARPAASRTRRAVSACSSALPWEKFSRATSIPASTIRASTSGSREAGPMVATIFVRRMNGEDCSGASGEVAVPLDDLAVGRQRPALLRLVIMSQWTALSFVPPEQRRNQAPQHRFPARLRSLVAAWISRSRRTGSGSSQGRSTNMNEIRLPS